MAQYNLSGNIDSNKVFLIKRSELEGRFEVQYYLPEINQLEKTIRKKSTKKLRDFIVKISSGATPSVQEEEKFYSDELNGIPFLRVQNLNPNSRIDLSNLRYINKETHKNYLRRSQVSEGDLLVKITGVGRMAIASVAPAGFIGNTNQHMAVIKTSDVEVSNYLANYLNLDLVERLASRRATGATRPALDYTALKSIPIIENIDFSIMNNAEELSRQKESEAKALLESIDSYLLEELGITLPERTNIKTEDIPTWMNSENLLVKNGRLFMTKLSEIEGQRLDAYYHLPYFKTEYKAMQESLYPLYKFGKLIVDLKNGVEIRDYVNEGIRYLRVSDMSRNGIVCSNQKFIEHQKVPVKIQLNKNCVLISRSGSLGLINTVDSEIEKCILSSHIFKVEIDSKKILPVYLEVFLRSQLGQFQFFRKNNGGVIPEINQEALKSIQIVLPPILKQAEIINHVTFIRNKAQVLKDEAEELINQAKSVIEQMILGE